MPGLFSLATFFHSRRYVIAPKLYEGGGPTKCRTFKAGLHSDKKIKIREKDGDKVPVALFNIKPRAD